MKNRADGCTRIGLKHNRRVGSVKITRDNHLFFLRTGGVALRERECVRELGHDERDVESTIASECESTIIIYIYIYNADVRDLGRDVTSARLSVDIYPSISSTLGVFTSAKNCVRCDLRADASRSEIRSVSRMAVRK